MDDLIGKYRLNDSICDKIIQYYHECDEKNQGVVYSNISKSNKVNKNIKDCIQVSLKPGLIFDLYFDELNHFLNNYYFSKYVFSRENLIVNQLPNIQFYGKRRSFSQFHYEKVRSSKNSIENGRHLVFMTYLNDVYWGGQTEFLYQKKKFSPRKGKTLIWPAEWTHTHRGIPAPFEEKMIITGWFNIQLDSPNTNFNYN